MNYFGNFKFLVEKMVHIPKWEFWDVTTQSGLGDKAKTNWDKVFPLAELNPA
jgi:hypothetical protein